MLDRLVLDYGGASTRLNTISPVASPLSSVPLRLPDQRMTQREVRDFWIVRLLRPRSFLSRGIPTRLWSPLHRLPNPRSGTPLSGYRSSDFVLWHTFIVDGRGATLAISWGGADTVPCSLARLDLVLARLIRAGFFEGARLS